MVPYLNFLYHWLTHNSYLTADCSSDCFEHDWISRSDSSCVRSIGSPCVIIADPGVRPCRSRVSWHCWCCGRCRFEFDDRWLANSSTWPADTWLADTWPTDERWLADIWLTASSSSSSRCLTETYLGKGTGRQQHGLVQTHVRMFHLVLGDQSIIIRLEERHCEELLIVFGGLYRIM